MVFTEPRSTSTDKNDDVTYKVIKTAPDKIKVELYWGEKPSRGYKIKIKEVKLEENNVNVVYSQVYPDPDSIYSQVISYPSDIWEGKVEKLQDNYQVKLSKQ
ncbi:protease complex subunit PrcB family protein [Alkaliphilus peptidifermentans]|uniref:PrcB C-terminal n=1 Tax=Alkaliphilus peptidifermentans DSM 18978 TaxID=1120976 RepID=A0A1G5KXJ4_9FIRM|nr:protease complex subunit PrcB family protein [Alkaliphilus peptidifermentans]SCZ05325.1 PrcB C-terminal [Alkaliphilus peptidifermentans DSM 18978]